MDTMDSYLEHSSNSKRVKRHRGKRWLSRGWRRTIIIEEPIQKNRKGRCLRGYPIILLILALAGLLFAKHIINKFQEKNTKIKNGENVSSNRTTYRNPETTIQMRNDASRVNKKVKPIPTASSTQTDLDSLFLIKRKHYNKSITPSSGSSQVTKKNDSLRSSKQPMRHTVRLSKTNMTYTNKPLFSLRNDQGLLTNPTVKHSNCLIKNISKSSKFTQKNEAAPTTKHPNTFAMQLHKTNEKHLGKNQKILPSTNDSIILFKTTIKGTDNSILDINTGLHVRENSNKMQLTTHLKPYNHKLNKTNEKHPTKNQTVTSATNYSTLLFKTTVREPENSILDISTGLHVIKDSGEMPTTKQLQPYNHELTNEKHPAKNQTVTSSTNYSTLLFKTTVSETNSTILNVSTDLHVTEASDEMQLTKHQQPYNVELDETNESDLRKNQTAIYSTEDSNLSLKSTLKETYSTILEMSTGLHIRDDSNEIQIANHSQPYNVRLAETNERDLVNDQNVTYSTNYSTLLLKHNLRETDNSFLNMSTGLHVTEDSGKLQISKHPHSYNVELDKTNESDLGKNRTGISFSNVSTLLVKTTVRDTENTFLDKITALLGTEDSVHHCAFHMHTTKQAKPYSDEVDETNESYLGYSQTAIYSTEDSNLSLKSTLRETDIPILDISTGSRVTEDSGEMHTTKHSKPYSDEVDETKESYLGYSQTAIYSTEDSNLSLKSTLRETDNPIPHISTGSRVTEDSGEMHTTKHAKPYSDEVDETNESYLGYSQTAIYSTEDSNLSLKSTLRETDIPILDISTGSRVTEDSGEMHTTKHSKPYSDEVDETKESYLGYSQTAIYSTEDSNLSLKSTLRETDNPIPHISTGSRVTEDSGEMHTTKHAKPYSDEVDETNESYLGYSQTAIYSTEDSNLSLKSTLRETDNPILDISTGSRVTEDSGEMHTTKKAKPYSDEVGETNESYLGYSQTAIYSTEDSNLSLKSTLRETDNPILDISTGSRVTEESGEMHTTKKAKPYSDEVGETNESYLGYSQTAIYSTEDSNLSLKSTLRETDIPILDISTGSRVTEDSGEMHTTKQAKPYTNEVDETKESYLGYCQTAIYSTEDSNLSLKSTLRETDNPIPHISTGSRVTEDSGEMHTTKHAKPYSDEVDETNESYLGYSQTVIYSTEDSNLSLKSTLRETDIPILDISTGSRVTEDSGEMHTTKQAKPYTNEVDETKESYLGYSQTAIYSTEDSNLSLKSTLRETDIPILDISTGSRVTEESGEMHTTKQAKPYSDEVDETNESYLGYSQTAIYSTEDSNLSLKSTLRETDNPIPHISTGSRVTEDSGEMHTTKHAKPYSDEVDETNESYLGYSQTVIYSTEDSNLSLKSTLRETDNPIPHISTGSRVTEDSGEMHTTKHAKPYSDEVDETNESYLGYSQTVIYSTEDSNLSLKSTLRETDNPIPHISTGSRVTEDSGEMHTTKHAKPYSDEVDETNESYLGYSQTVIYSTEDSNLSLKSTLRETDNPIPHISTGSRVTEDSGEMHTTKHAKPYSDEVDETNESYLGYSQTVIYSTEDSNLSLKSTLRETDNPIPHISTGSRVTEDSGEMHTTKHAKPYSDEVDETNDSYLGYSQTAIYSTEDSNLSLKSTLRETDNPMPHISTGSRVTEDSGEMHTTKHAKPYSDEVDETNESYLGYSQTVIYSTEDPNLSLKSTLRETDIPILDISTGSRVTEDSGEMHTTKQAKPYTNEVDETKESYLGYSQTAIYSTEDSNLSLKSTLRETDSPILDISTGSRVTEESGEMHTTKQAKPYSDEVDETNESYLGYSQTAIYSTEDSNLSLKSTLRETDNPILDISTGSRVTEDSGEMHTTKHAKPYSDEVDETNESYLGYSQTAIYSTEDSNLSLKSTLRETDIPILDISTGSRVTEDSGEMHTTKHAKPYSDEVDETNESYLGYSQTVIYSTEDPNLSLKSTLRETDIPILDISTGSRVTEDSGEMHTTKQAKPYSDEVDETNESYLGYSQTAIYSTEDSNLSLKSTLRETDIPILDISTGSRVTEDSGEMHTTKHSKPYSDEVDETKESYLGYSQTAIYSTEDSNLSLKSTLRETDSPILDISTGSRVTEESGEMHTTKQAKPYSDEVDETNESYLGYSQTAIYSTEDSNLSLKSTLRETDNPIPHISTGLRVTEDSGEMHTTKHAKPYSDEVDETNESYLGYSQTVIYSTEDSNLSLKSTLRETDNPIPHISTGSRVTEDSGEMHTTKHAKPYSDEVDETNESYLGYSQTAIYSTEDSNLSLKSTLRETDNPMPHISTGSRVTEDSGEMHTTKHAKPYSDEVDETNESYLGYSQTAIYSTEDSNLSLKSTLRETDIPILDISTGSRVTEDSGEMHTTKQAKPYSDEVDETNESYLGYSQTAIYSTEDSNLSLKSTLRETDIPILDISTGSRVTEDSGEMHTTKHAKPYSDEVDETNDSYLGYSQTAIYSTEDSNLSLKSTLRETDNPMPHISTGSRVTEDSGEMHTTKHAKPYSDEVDETNESYLGYSQTVIYSTEDPNLSLKSTLRETDIPILDISTGSRVTEDSGEMHTTKQAKPYTNEVDETKESYLGYSQTAIYSTEDSNLSLKSTLRETDSPILDISTGSRVTEESGEMHTTKQAKPYSDEVDETNESYLGYSQTAIYSTEDSNLSLKSTLRETDNPILDISTGSRVTEDSGEMHTTKHAKPYSDEVDETNESYLGYSQTAIYSTEDSNLSLKSTLRETDIPILDISTGSRVTEDSGEMHTTKHAKPYSDEVDETNESYLGYSQTVIYSTEDPNLSLKSTLRETDIPILDISTGSRVTEDSGEMHTTKQAKPYTNEVDETKESYLGYSQTAIYSTEDSNLSLKSTLRETDSPILDISTGSRVTEESGEMHTTKQAKPYSDEVDETNESYLGYSQTAIYSTEDSNLSLKSTLRETDNPIPHISTGLRVTEDSGEMHTTKHAKPYSDEVDETNESYLGYSQTVIYSTEDSNLSLKSTLRETDNPIPHISTGSRVTEDSGEMHTTKHAKPYSDEVDETNESYLGYSQTAIYSTEDSNLSLKSTLRETDNPMPHISTGSRVTEDSGEMHTTKHAKPYSDEVDETNESYLGYSQTAIYSTEDSNLSLKSTLRETDIPILDISTGSRVTEDSGEMHTTKQAKPYSDEVDETNESYLGYSQTAIYSTEDSNLSLKSTLRETDIPILDISTGSRVTEDSGEMHTTKHSKPYSDEVDETNESYLGYSQTAIYSTEDSNLLLKSTLRETDNPIPDISTGSRVTEDSGEMHTTKHAKPYSDEVDETNESYLGYSQTAIYSTEDSNLSLKSTLRETDNSFLDINTGVVITDVTNELQITKHPKSYNLRLRETIDSDLSKSKIGISSTNESTLLFQATVSETDNSLLVISASPYLSQTSVINLTTEHLRPLIRVSSQGVRLLGNDSESLIKTEPKDSINSLLGMILKVRSHLGRKRIRRPWRKNDTGLFFKTTVKQSDVSKLNVSISSKASKESGPNKATEHTKPYTFEIGKTNVKHPLSNNTAISLTYYAGLLLQTIVKHFYNKNNKDSNVTKKSDVMRTTKLPELSKVELITTPDISIDDYDSLYDELNITPDDTDIDPLPNRDMHDSRRDELFKYINNDSLKNHTAIPLTNVSGLLFQPTVSHFLKNNKNISRDSNATKKSDVMRTTKLPELSKVELITTPDISIDDYDSLYDELNITPDDTDIDPLPNRDMHDSRRDELFKYINNDSLKNHTAIPLTNVSGLLFQPTVSHFLKNNKNISRDSNATKKSDVMRTTKLPELSKVELITTQDINIDDYDSLYDELNITPDDTVIDPLQNSDLYDSLYDELNITPDDTVIDPLPNRDMHDSRRDELFKYINNDSLKNHTAIPLTNVSGLLFQPTVSHFLKNNKNISRDSNATKKSDVMRTTKLPELSKVELITTQDINIDDYDSLYDELNITPDDTVIDPLLNRDMHDSRRGELYTIKTTADVFSIGSLFNTAVKRPNNSIMTPKMVLKEIKPKKIDVTQFITNPYVVLDEVNLKIIKGRSKRMHIENSDIPALKRAEPPYILLNEINLRNMDPIPLALPKRNITELILTATFKHSNESTLASIKSLGEERKIKNNEMQTTKQQRPNYILLNEINLKHNKSIPIMFPMRNDSDLLLTVTFKHSNNSTITASGSLQETMKSSAMQATEQPKTPYVLLNKINLKSVESISPIFLLGNESDFLLSTTVKKSNNSTVATRRSSQEKNNIDAKQTKKGHEQPYIVLNEINLKQIESIPVLFPIRNDSDFLFTATFHYANESTMGQSGISQVTKNSDDAQTEQYPVGRKYRLTKINAKPLGSNDTVYPSRNDTGLFFKTTAKHTNVSILNLSTSSKVRKKSDPIQTTKYPKQGDFILNGTDYKHLGLLTPLFPVANDSGLLFTVTVEHDSSGSSQETVSTANLPRPFHYVINKTKVDQMEIIPPLGNDLDAVFFTMVTKLDSSSNSTMSLTSNLEERIQVKSDMRPTTAEPEPMKTEVPLSKYDENNIDIKDYDMLISYNTTHLWGVVSLTIEFDVIMDKVVLHFEGDEVTFPTVFIEKNINSSLGYLNAKVRSMVYDHERRRIIIKLIDKMNPGNNYVYKMNFTSALNRFERGATLISYAPRIIDLTDIPVQRWTIGLYLFPSDGKKVFPCIEAPHRRSTFHLKINNRGHDTITSNTIRNRTSDGTNPKHQIDDFERTPAIPVSSFAFFILPNYNFVNIERKLTPSIVIWYPENLKYSVKPLVQIAASSLDFFYEFFQYEIPTQQISIIVSEGMYSEPPAAFASIVISSKYIYESLKGTYESTEKLHYYMAKQFCNLWLGNIVSFNSWNDNWISEGFSIYMAHLAATELYPDYDKSSFIIRTQEKAFKYHRFSQLRTDINNFQNMNKSVINGTPFKAAFLFHMVYKILKPNNFREGIRAFFKIWALKSADPDDLWNSFNIVQGNIDIAKFIRTWSIYYYPTVNVELGNKKVIIEQIQTSGSKYEVSSWWIPINYISSLDYNFDYTITHWMKKEKKIQIRIHLNPSWIVVNPGHSAFFRTNYTDTLWRAIAIELRNKYTKIPRDVKAQILDDAFTLASDGLLDYAVPMTISLYLSNEVEYTPWATALKHFSYIANFLMGYSEWKLFQKYISTIMLKITNKLGLTRENDSAINNQLRKLLMEWSCLNEIPNGCVEWAGYQFQKWKNDMASLSQYGNLSELRGLIYCMGAKIGGDDETNFLYSFSKMHMITIEEEIMVLRAVTCSDRFHTFEDILVDIFNVSSPTFSIVRLKEFWGSLGNSQNNLLISFEYVKYNWPMIYKQFHGANGLLNILIEGSTYFLKKKAQLKEVIKLRNIVPQNDYSLLDTFDYTIEQISYNINWEAKYSGKVRRWLRYNQK